jgi:general secretion pathway protein F
MQYAARYYDPARSSVVESVIDAESDATLRERLQASGCVVLSAAPHQQGSHGLARRIPPWSLWKERFALAWWCRELRTLLSAGMTVVEAIETLVAQEQGGERARVNRELLERLRAGQALSKAMRGIDVFPTVLVASVTASERTSTLAQALDDFLRYDELLQKLRRQVVSAAIYPAVVVGLGVLIALFLLLYVIPRFSRMYGGVRGDVSWATSVLLGFSELLREQTSLLLLGAVALLGAAVWLLSSGRLQALLMLLVEAIGPLRRAWDEFRLAKLFQSLALMFRGGYTLPEALKVSEGLGLGARLTSGITQAQQLLEQGRPVSHALQAAGATDVVSQRLLTVGERTGGFDAVLQTIADRHAERFTTFVERVTRIVEPLLLLIVALVVGGIVVMMYMPIFDMASSLR